MAKVDIDIMDQKQELEDSGDGDEILGLVDDAQGNMTYRLVHIAGEDGNSSISNSSGSQLYQTTNDNSQTMTTVLGNSLNGKYPVFGGTSDIFNNSGTITIIPRDSNQKTVPTVKKRDDRRRATHNEVERRRRDKINNWIMRLSKLIPAQTDSNNDKSVLEVQSKGGILARACEYIIELKENQQRLSEVLLDNERLTNELNTLFVEMTSLKKENQLLKNSFSPNAIKDELSEDS